ncbi:hypothetical protein CJF25_16335 [Photobacterium phosphoreum]|uniref:ABC-three component system protein n=1 Tax=Photobacterium phosphoreum TaxID=659 RepID=UPI001E2BFF59|nr:ABC-three component system protein [Photobacterium phosphoreum]MCD9464533.1 hypothetical protein [Photobacterium phosphoreum]
MMVNKEVLNSLNTHSVIVCEGSGVLIQPASDEYSYILTAKHVIEDIEIKDIEITDSDDKLLTALNVYHHKELDASIVKVKFRGDITISAFYELEEVPRTLSLKGFPKKTRNPDTSCLSQIESYQLQLISTLQNSWVYRNESYAPYEDIEGCSGGGVFYVHHVDGHEKASLAGIETQVIRNKEGLSHDHLGVIPIHAFHDIIRDKCLPELKPVYLTNFKFCKNDIFNSLDLDSTNNLDCVRQTLRALIEEQKITVSTITPEKILDTFEDQILSCRQLNCELEEQSLWIWFLEFIAIQLVISPPDFTVDSWESKYLDYIFDSYRFVYSSNEIGHRSLYRKLVLPTDLSSLKEKSKIMLLVNGTLPKTPLLPRTTVGNISNGLSESDISTVRTNSKRSNEIVHWNRLNDECLSESEIEFSSLNIFDNEDQIIKMLKDKYTPYLLNDEC